MKNTRLSTERLEKIRLRVEALISKNRKEVGTGKELSGIEDDLLSGVLDIGKLLLEDRIMSEEESLESTDYRIEGKKNKDDGNQKPSLD